MDAIHLKIRDFDITAMNLRNRAAQLIKEAEECEAKAQPLKDAVKAEEAKAVAEAEAAKEAKAKKPSQK